MNNKIEKIYLWAIELGVYVALFTPLVIIKSYFFPYVAPKTLFFRIAIDVIFIIYILNLNYFLFHKLYLVIYFLRTHAIFKNASNHWQ